MLKKQFIAIFTLIVLLAGCATNPVTGKNELMLVSEQQELAIGQKNYLPMRQAQGGDYTVDPELTQYINEVGHKLAAVSDRKLPYEFKVLNNSVPNAWALPGGKIVMNRGLLTELKSEAELAAVLGHEIIHAAAKHSAKSMSQGVFIQGAVMAAVIGTAGKDYAQLAQLGAGLGAQLVSQKYGRDAERESDLYGMRYMSKAGYNPQGAVDLQETFVRLSEGQRSDWLSGLFASHPPSRERVERNKATLTTLPNTGIVGRERYQQKTAHLMATRDAYKAYDEGRVAFKKDDINTAEKKVQEAIRKEPREGHFYALLGDIAQKRNKPEQAKNDYNRAISLNDNFFYYYLQRGEVNKKLNHLAAAKSDFTKSNQLLPSADAHNSLGVIAEGQGQYDQAKMHYEKAAGNQSEAGKNAYGSLVRLDLPNNPGKYVKVRTGKKNGSVIAELSNQTPKAIAGLVLAIQYVDAKGKLRSGQKVLRGSMEPNSKEVINLGLKGLTPEQLKTLKVSITKARLKESKYKKTRL